jgi:NAD(P)-dependent dehydrogenase (short-subunit alcohol dehydrogenase family)
MSMKHAVILGIGSDIGQMIAERLKRDGWVVTGFRHDDLIHVQSWDLIVCCYGVLDPIGPFFATHVGDWVGAFEVNLFEPVREIYRLYPRRRPGASVCFFSGAGANGPAPTYSAYCVSKIALVKMVECMDAESEDCKFFILGPGMMRTKIQEQTLAAGERAANYRRVLDFMESDSAGTPPDDVYECLMHCVAASKAAVGGRNIYVPLDDWTRLEELAEQPDAFKLRRANDAGLRRPKLANSGDDSLCCDCPPVGHPSDQTRCKKCPRRSQ